VQLGRFWPWGFGTIAKVQIREWTMGVLIVTGSSRGTGAAVARLAARRGWSVCINSSRSHEKAENVAAGIRSDGGQSIAAVADISSPREVEAMFEKVREEFGPVAGLVSNGATEGSQGRIEDMNPEATRRLFEINVFGQFSALKQP